MTQILPLIGYNSYELLMNFTRFLISYTMGSDFLLESTIQPFNNYGLALVGFSSKRRCTGQSTKHNLILAVALTINLIFFVIVISYSKADASCCCRECTFLLNPRRKLCVLHFSVW